MDESANILYGMSAPTKLNYNLGWGKTHGHGSTSPYLKEAELQIVKNSDPSCPVIDQQGQESPIELKKHLSYYRHDLDAGQKS